METYAILPFADRIKPFEDSEGTVHVITDGMDEQLSVNMVDYQELIVIIRNVVVFFDLKDLVEVKVLNSKISKDFLTDELYAHICCLRLKYTSPEKLLPRNVREHFNKLSGYFCENFEELFKITHKSKNLLKNPGFDNVFESWSKISGGTGPNIENLNLYKDKKNVMMTSHSWGGVNQSVTLPQGNNRVVVGGAIIARRVDCGSDMQLVLTVGNEKGDLIQPVPGKVQGYSIYDWNVVSVNLKVANDETEAAFTVLGKDQKFWAGCYGAYIGYIFLYSFEIPN